MNRFSRSTALKIAAVLSFILSAISVVGSLPLIVQGAATFNQTSEGPPYFILILGLITAVVGIVAAVGTWKGQRWAIIFTILVRLIEGLSAAPGILFASSTGWFISATLSVVASIAIIVLCLWRDRKLVTA